MSTGGVHDMRLRACCTSYLPCRGAGGVLVPRSSPVSYSHATAMPGCWRCFGSPREASNLPEPVPYMYSQRLDQHTRGTPPRGTPPWGTAARGGRPHGACGSVQMQPLQPASHSGHQHHPASSTVVPLPPLSLPAPPPPLVPPPPRPPPPLGQALHDGTRTPMGVHQHPET